MNTTCIRQLRYSEKVPWEKEFFAKGPVDKSAKKSDKKTLEQIKDHADSNGDDPSTWDEKNTSVLQAKVDDKKTTTAKDKEATATEEKDKATTSEGDNEKKT